METPIADFVREYERKNMSRLHMPGHKGKGAFGCEKFDITEVEGADALYEADGIIAESERNAALLFGTERTVFSCEGSSQCIRAMVYLALTNSTAGGSRLILAARNVHKSFVYACALADAEVKWLYPDDASNSICSCHVSAKTLENTLSSLKEPPAAVYITSPSYLGEQADIALLADVCHRYGTVLIVDNAHGAYLHFLKNPVHPIDLGADMCCDSAHKTLNSITGTAYLHVSKNAPVSFAENARNAMAIFGSTSPSYLMLVSLDMLNRYLSNEYTVQLNAFVNRIAAAKTELVNNGWRILKSDPLRITVEMPLNLNGRYMASVLREFGVECEYADIDHLVLMTTPNNDPADIGKAVAAFGFNKHPYLPKKPLNPVVCAKKMSLRQAVFSTHETVDVNSSIGRVCASPTVSCPPAIPIAVSGEVINISAAELFKYYGIGKVDVVKE